MKRILLLPAFFCGMAFTAVSQEKCATMPMLEHNRQLDNHLSESMQKNEKVVAEWIERNRHERRTVITIPVVFHVVYENAAENIHDSLLISQLNVLNEDYRRTNLDASFTRGIFDSIASDVEIEFCLAKRDPEGNPHSGITRTQTTTTSFNPITQFDAVKASSSGGKDPWPATDYLNIWVCDMSFFGQVFVLGYAQFPGGNASTDGVVLQYQHVGRTNTASAAPANLGRTATHEVGHWLGLRHIWGDGPCDSTDYVADTPNASDASQSDCDTVKNSCNLEDAYWGAMDPPDMVENYMDYSADACMNSFTNGQKLRMLGFLNTLRSSLLTSDGCLPAFVSVSENETAGIFEIFPNPSNGQVNFRWDRLSEIRITDIAGKLVKTVDAESAGNIVIEFSSGFYLVSGIMSNGDMITKRLIVR